MKLKTLGVAVAVAAGMLSTSAYASLFGNTSQKGSLLIFPRIDVSTNEDTFVTIGNDSINGVRVKCYYNTSDRIPTPYTGTAAGARSFKHFFDFTFPLTHNQAFTWEASSGEVEDASANTPGNVGGPFDSFPDAPLLGRQTGELKCWAVNTAGEQISYNHLWGNATILNVGTLQATEYAAWAFQSQVATGAVVGTPGKLDLNGTATGYDYCPNILIGSYFPSGAPPGEDGEVDPNTIVTLASCNQDLRQDYTPTITKLTWTFWNQDEDSRTGTHFCADSWFETSFPAATWPLAQYRSLQTTTAYFRIETTADRSWCGISATTSAYVGVKQEQFGAGLRRGTNLTGRGSAFGTILYDVGPADSFKK